MLQQTVRRFLARRDFLRFGLGSTIGAAGVALLNQTVTAQVAPGADPLTPLAWGHGRYARPGRS